MGMSLIESGNSALAWIERQCAEQPEVLALLAWLEPPDNLQAFSLVLIGFEALIPNLSQLIKKHNCFKKTNTDTIGSWGFALQQLKFLLTKPGFIASCPDLVPSGESFRGVTANHPLYVYIGSISPLALNEKYFFTVSLIYLVYRELLADRTDNKNYKSSANNAINSVRYALNSSAHRHFPVEPETVEDYYVLIKEMCTSSSTLVKSSVDDYFEKIERMLRFFLEKTGGNRSGGRIIRELKFRIDGVGGLDINLQVVGGENDEKRLIFAKKSGISLDELSTEVEFYSVEEVLDEDEEYSTGEPLGKQVLRRKSFLSQLEKSNQLLASDWSRLGDPEIAYFLHGIKEVKELKNGERLIKEASTALAVMFWTGRNISQVLRLRLYVDESCLPKNIPSNFFAYLIHEKTFIVAAIRPKGAPKYRKANLSLAHVVTDRFYIPVGAYVHPYILELNNRFDLSDVGMWGNADSIEAFKCDADELAAAIKKQICTLNFEYGIRLTESRIGAALFNRIYTYSGDLVLASLGLGLPHRLSDTALHYSSLQAEQLSTKIKVTAEQMAQQAQEELAAAGIKPLIIQNGTEDLSNNRRLGSPIDPLPSTILKLVDQLSDAVALLRSDVLTLDYRLAVHNAYAAYVHTILRFATGLRDVGIPLRKWDRVNLERGLIFLSDKDDVASYQSRILPLPEMAVMQLKKWKQYVEQYALPFLDANKVKNSQKKQTAAVDTRNSELSTDLVIFYLKKKGKAQEIVLARSTDKVVRDEILSFIPDFQLPWNCNRHYLRSRLIEADCPGEFIDAFMGHWTRGREPWGQYSALSAEQIFNKLRPLLAQFLQQLNFRVV